MKALRLLAVAPLIAALGGTAQAAPDPHAGHDMAAMPGMAMPAAPAATPADDPHAGHDMGGTAQPVAPGSGTDPHAGHHMGGATKPADDSHAGHGMSGATQSAAPDAGADPHAGHDMSGMAMPVGTALPAGTALAPTPPADRWADQFYPPAEMQRARALSRKEHGGGTFSQIMFNLAEYQVRKGRDGYRWDGEGWFGGDIDRLTIKTEGEGTVRGAVDAAEVQALWSHALDPYWNLQAGARVDFQPGPTRTYATIGVEGLAPYWFEVEGALFLSDQGDLLGRAEAYYDQRITQRLVLQPRVELNFAAQDVAANRIGAGLSNAELGLRLRYEIAREFAPYVGVSWDRKTGQTARCARADGEGASEASFVAGVRFWF